MKRSLAILVLASAVGLAIAGCTQAAKPPASVTGPSAGSATASESAPSGSGTASQSTSPPSGATAPETKPAAAIATLAKFNKVQKGMTLAQVEKIMGPPGKKLGESSSGSIHVAMYGWYGEDTFAVAVVSLLNGKVSATHQEGLK